MSERHAATPEQGAVRPAPSTDRYERSTYDKRGNEMSCNPATTHRYEYDGQRRVCKRCGDVFPADAAMTPPREPRPLLARTCPPCGTLVWCEAEAAGAPLREALEQAKRDRNAAYGSNTIEQHRSWSDEEVRRCEANATLAATPAPAPLDQLAALEVISAEYGPNAEIHVDSPKELADYLVDLYAALTERSAT